MTQQLEQYATFCMKIKTHSIARHISIELQSLHTHTMLSLNLFILFAVGVSMGEKISLVRETFDEDHQIEYDHTKLKNKDKVGVESGHKDRVGYVDFNKEIGPQGTGQATRGRDSNRRARDVESESDVPRRPNSRGGRDEATSVRGSDSDGAARGGNGGVRGGQAGGAAGFPTFPNIGKMKLEAIKQEKVDIFRYGANSDLDFEDEHLKKRDRTSHKKEEIMKET